MEGAGQTEKDNKILFLREKERNVVSDELEFSEDSGEYVVVLVERMERYEMVQTSSEIRNIRIGFLEF